MNAGQPPPGVSWPVVTPFSKAAFDEVGRRLAGGKPDDITAVVAYIVSSSGPPATETQQHGKSNGSSPSYKPNEQLTGQGRQAAVGDTFTSGSSSSKGSEKNTMLPKSGGLQQASLQGGLSTGGSRSSFPPRNIGVVPPAIKASIHSVPHILKPGDYTVFERLKERAQQRLQRASSVRAGQQSREGISRSWNALPSAFVLAFRSLFSTK